MGSRWHAVGLGLIVAAGAALRFWNIGAGYPYRIGVDEPVIAERAIAILKTGDFHPHFFDYPGFYIYTQAIVAVVRFLTGAMNGQWISLDQFHPEHLFLWTRSLNALLGTVTILVVYRAGLRWGPRVALVGAGLMAVWLNHVRESHFALTDVPLTLLTALVLVLSLRALETGRLASFVAAGAGVGLAAATKYNGAVALVVPLLAAAASRHARPSRVLCALGATAAAGGAFLMAAPYTILDLPAFLNAFAAMSASYQPRPFLEGARIYFGHLNVTLGRLGVLALQASVLWAVVRALRERQAGRWAILLAFPLLYFQVVATKRLIFARYLLPLVPFACVLMGVLIVDAAAAVARLKRPRAARLLATPALVALVLFHGVRAGLAWPAQYGRRTTQDVAYRMIEEFVPPGSGVAIENSVLRLPDSKYRARMVPRLTDRSPEEYRSMQIGFLVASSVVFGPVLANPDARPAEFAAYRRLFEEAGRCLPAATPTEDVTGPEIRVCRIPLD